MNLNDVQPDDILEMKSGTTFHRYRVVGLNNAKTGVIVEHLSTEVLYLWTNNYLATYSQNTDTFGLRFVNDIFDRRTTVPA